MKSKVIFGSVITVSGLAMLTAAWLYYEGGRQPLPLTDDNPVTSEEVLDNDEADLIEQVQSEFALDRHLIASLGQLDALTNQEVLDLWQQLIEQQEIIRTGDFGMQRLEGDLLFNEISDRLCLMTSSEVTRHELEKVNAIFQKLLTLDEMDSLFLDYTIQSAVLWMIEDNENPYRDEIRETIFSHIITPERQLESYTGTALNMFINGDDSWNQREQEHIQKHLQQFCESLPALETLPDDVAIPVVHVIDYWGFDGFGEYLSSGEANGTEYLQYIIKKIKETNS